MRRLKSAGNNKKTINSRPQHRKVKGKGNCKGDYEVALIPTSISGIWNLELDKNKMGAEEMKEK